jgi:DNA-binding NtrC family response regulator
MNRQDSEKMGKIMLVCSKPSAEVEKCLRSAGGEVVTVNDGEAAIIQAQHARFNMAVLVSTGKTMDLAETVFNLRDISSSMPILIIDERHGVQKSQAEMVAHASPNTRALTVHDLAAYLGTSGSLPRRTFGKRHQQYKY